MYFQVFYSMGILLMYFQVFLFYGIFCSCTSKYFYSMGFSAHVLPSIFILWDFLLMYFQVFFILWEFYSCTSKYFFYGILLMYFQVFLFLTGCIRLLNVCKIFLTLAKSLLLWRKARRACSDINSFCCSV